MIHIVNMLIWLIIFIIIVILMDRLQQALKCEENLARMDMVAQVPNRRAFYEFFEREIDRIPRSGTPLTLVYIDIDNFKNVNDTFGHQAGDEMLKVVAKTIQRNIRTIDMVARLGGDEFGVLLSGTSGGEAEAVIKKIMKLLLQEMEKNTWPVTFSIGAVTCNNPFSSVMELIKRADSLMYAVKTSGKGSFRHEILG